jgi:hypothetical protein
VKTARSTETSVSIYQDYMTPHARILCVNVHTYEDDLKWGKDRMTKFILIKSKMVIFSHIFMVLYFVGASHMSDNRQMSVAIQRLVDFISMVTNSTLLRNNTVTLY